MPTQDHSTYSITYQYKPGNWHTHADVDKDSAQVTLRMLSVLDRTCRVRQNATGHVLTVEPRACGIEPPLLLHLFSNGISDRNGKVTE